MMVPVCTTPVYVNCIKIATYDSCWCVFDSLPRFLSLSMHFTQHARHTLPRYFLHHHIRRRLLRPLCLSLLFPLPSTVPPCCVSRRYMTHISSARHWVRISESSSTFTPTSFLSTHTVSFVFSFQLYFLPVAGSVKISHLSISSTTSFVTACSFPSPAASPISSAVGEPLLPSARDQKTLGW